MNSPEEHNAWINTGKIMLFSALILGLLTLFFSHQEEQRYNPNQTVNSHTDDYGHRVVTIEQNAYGHYVVSGTINQKGVTFLVDTGATDVAIPGQIESKLQLSRGPKIHVQTANGVSEAYITRLKALSIGNITLNDVRATIAPNMIGDEVLLGMSVLKQLDLNQTGRQLQLRQ